MWAQPKCGQKQGRNQDFLNLRPTVGRGEGEHPRAFFVDSKKKTGGVFHLPCPHLLRDICKSYDPRSYKVRSPGQVKWQHYTETLQSRHSYSALVKVMKRSEYEVIGTYKMYISGFSICEFSQVIFAAS